MLNSCSYYYYFQRCSKFLFICFYLYFFSSFHVSFLSLPPSFHPYISLPASLLPSLYISLNLYSSLSSLCFPSLSLIFLSLSICSPLRSPKSHNRQHYLLLIIWTWPHSATQAKAARKPPRRKAHFRVPCDFIFSFHVERDTAPVWIWKYIRPIIFIMLGFLRFYEVILQR